MASLKKIRNRSGRDVITPSNSSKHSETLGNFFGLKYSFLLTKIQESKGPTIQKKSIEEIDLPPLSSVYTKSKGFNRLGRLFRKKSRTKEKESIPEIEFESVKEDQSKQQSKKEHTKKGHTKKEQTKKEQTKKGQTKKEINRGPKCSKALSYSFQPINFIEPEDVSESSNDTSNSNSSGKATPQQLVGSPLIFRSKLFSSFSVTKPKKEKELSLADSLENQKKSDTESFSSPMSEKFSPPTKDGKTRVKQTTSASRFLRSTTFSSYQYSTLGMGEKVCPQKSEESIHVLSDGEMLQD